MSRVAQFVSEHTRPAGILALAFIVAAAIAAGQAARDIAEEERLTRLKIDAELLGVDLMSQTMNGQQMGAVALLGLIDEPVKQEARNELAPNSRRAAKLMEDIARAHDADGTYIVGGDGIIKSSWGVGRALTGVDVRFRPYFQMASKGKENVYAAIGTTTGRRNLYFAAPMHAGSTTDTPVIGAVVIRTGVVRLDKLLTGKADIALLLSPQGVAFASSREGWIGRVAGQVTPERIGEIRRLKQFGTMFDNRDPEPLPITVEPGISDQGGDRRAVVQTKVNWNDPYGDWTLVLIEDLGRTVPIADRLWVAAATALALLLVGSLMFILLRGHHAQRLAAARIDDYARAQQASAQRKAAIAAAAMRLQRTRTVGDLVQAFLGEVHSLLGGLQGVVYVAAQDSEVFRLAGSYACATPVPPEVAAGEGLLGQCAVERRTLMVEAPDEGYWRIRSGLGGTLPTAVLMAPVLLGETLLGIVEVAIIRQADGETRERFDELVQLLALNLEVLRRSEHTEKVLAATSAAERASAEQAAFQQVLMDTIPYPVFYKGPDTRFLGFNRAYEETFKVSREDLIGKRVLDLDYLPEADRIAYQTEDEAVVAATGTVQREMRMPFADGRLHETLYFVSGFRNPDGSPGGLVGTFIDISAQKNAEKEIDRLADAERFNRLAQGRELRILELKREVNALAQAAGRPKPYGTDLVETSGDHELAPHPDYRTDVAIGAADLQLSDLVDLDELQRLFTAFCESVGIAAAIIDPAGRILVSARWQRACTDFHRVNPDSCRRCIESDTELALQLDEGAEFTMYKCKNGMTDAAAPIVVEGRHLANVFIGQFHASRPDMEFFTAQARQFGYPEGDYLQAVQEAPILDERRLPVILGFLAGFARLISTMSLARRRADAAQARLEEQADLLRKERLAAMSLAEDNVQARMALEQGRPS